MDKRGSVILLALSLLLISCTGRPSGSSDRQQPDRKVPELLATVPSDALAVAHYDKCSEGIMLLDSTSILRALDLSSVSGRKMALTLCYNGSLTPVISIETAADSRDSLNMADLMSQAKALKLQAAHFSAEEIGGRRGATVITTSESQLSAIRRHVAGKTSIMDAQNFKAALNASGSADSFIILKTAGADRYLPKDFLGGRFNRRELTAFMKTASEWITAVPQGKSMNIIPVHNGSDVYYAKAMEDMPTGDSKLDAILPASTTFMLSMPVETGGFRQAYERYIDANVKLEKYSSRLAALKKGSGKDPLKWEKELDVKEVAIVCWEGHEVIIVRPSKAVRDKHVEENPYRGFITALYGQAFSLVDDICTAQAFGCHIYGSELDVNEFILCDERMVNATPLLKAGHFLVYEPERMTNWTKKGIKTWNSSL